MTRTEHMTDDASSVDFPSAAELAMGEAMRELADSQAPTHCADCGERVPGCFCADDTWGEMCPADVLANASANRAALARDSLWD